MTAKATPVAVALCLGFESDSPLPDSHGMVVVDDIVGAAPVGELPSIVRLLYGGFWYGYGVLRPTSDPGSSPEALNFRARWGLLGR